MIWMLKNEDLEEGIREDETVDPVDVLVDVSVEDGVVSVEDEGLSGTILLRIEEKNRLHHENREKIDDQVDSEETENHSGKNENLAEIVLKDDESEHLILQNQILVEIVHLENEIHLVFSQIYLSHQMEHVEVLVIANRSHFLIEKVVLEVRDDSVKRKVSENEVFRVIKNLSEAEKATDLDLDDQKILKVENQVKIEENEKIEVDLKEEKDSRIETLEMDSVEAEDRHEDDLADVEDEDFPEDNKLIKKERI